MEAPELTCPSSPARDQPAPAPAPPEAPGGQASPHLTLGHVILPPEQGLAPAVFLKALPIPLYHTVPPGSLQPRAPLVTGSLDGGNVPFILSPLLQPEGPGPTQVGKPSTLTVNIVGALPVLSPSLGPTLGSPGKMRNIGKYLCPHCGRDCLKPSVLEKHIRSHTGERPFPCATCGIAFKTQSNLYKHRRTQTHLNNSRLSSELDGSGGPILDEGDKARADGRGDSQSQRPGEGALPETPLTPGVQGTGHSLSPVTKNLDMKLETFSCLGSTSADREAPSPGAPLAGTPCRWKLPEQRSPQTCKSYPVQLQQHQATSLERPGDTKATEGRLRKCESTDSGYLSRSDSIEQPMAPCSPLHSLSEHSTELEGDATLGTRRAGPGEREASLELEKKQLEERIARLISHNQAVVDDSQLDNVRPRKTVLSKQGSIDLPMPYTYKDSFHFDIRALEPGRRRPAALCSTRSTLAPLDRSRPLFFHSVPTQLSTTMECVPVTRSNSLPFVEGTRTWPEPPDLQDSSLRKLKPLSPRPSPAQLCGRLGLTWVDIPSGHPRALVRQAAVEDLPCPPSGDSLASTEDPEGKRTPAREGIASKGKAIAKKGSPRKLQMFSQEKWQVYGNETFQRIYQKMKSSRHGAKKAKEARAGNRPLLETPLQEETTGQGAALSQDISTPGHRDIAVGARPGPWGIPAVSEGFSVAEHAKQREKVARAESSEQPKLDKAVSPPSLCCREAPNLCNKNPVLLPGKSLEQGCQLPSAGLLKEGDLKSPGLILPKSTTERDTHSAGGEKENDPLAQSILRRASEIPGETQSVENKLPSERKKLKVEQESRKDQPKPSGVGGQAPGGPVQAVSPPTQEQDNGPEKKPRSLPESTSDILATLTDMTFPPKYLLQLPQGETESPLPVSKGQGQDPLCRHGWSEEDPFVGSGLGTLMSHSPMPAPALGRTDDFKEDPSCSRPWDRRKGVQGEEREDKTDTSTPATGEPDLTSKILGETAPFLPPLMCSPCMTQDTKAETQDLSPLHMDNALLRANPFGGVLNSWVPDKKLGAPENAQEDLPLGSLAGLNPCCSLGSVSFLAPTPPSRFELTLSNHPGTPESSEAQGPFPSLRAEPQLTWCCVSRSLPLPMEQKEKAASVYLALHLPGGRLRNEGSDAQGVNKALSGRWTSIYPEGGQTQTWKLSCTVAPGMMPQHHASEPRWKKELPRRRLKTSRGSSRQSKLSTTSKRYKVNFLQSRIPQRVSRLRKPLRVLRKDHHLPHLQGPGPRGTFQQTCSGMAGLNPPEKSSCVTSDQSLCCENQEKKEDHDRQCLRSFTPSASSMTVQEINKVSTKDISLSASGLGDSCPQNKTTPSLLFHGKDLHKGLLETDYPPSQVQDVVSHESCAFSDAQELSSSESKGISPHHNATTSATAIDMSLGADADNSPLGVHSVEAQDHDCDARDTVTQSPQDKKTRAEAISLSSLPAKCAPGMTISSSLLLGSSGKRHQKIPVTDSSHMEKGNHKGQYGSRKIVVPYLPQENDSGKYQISGLVTLKDCVPLSDPGEITEPTETHLKTIKKRSLEGMRKQTRVEFSDTSSDDEDRLVIEI